MFCFILFLSFNKFLFFDCVCCQWVCLKRQISFTKKTHEIILILKWVLYLSICWSNLQQLNLIQNDRKSKGIVTIRKVVLNKRRDKKRLIFLKRVCRFSVWNFFFVSYFYLIGFLFIFYHILNYKSSLAFGLYVFCSVVVFHFVFNFISLNGIMHTLICFIFVLLHLRLLF